MKSLFLALVGVVFIAGSVYLFLEKPAPSKYGSRGEPLAEIKVGSHTVVAELANTPEKRQLGLSGRQGLEEGRGMLFVFDQPGRHGIWMKDMLFPIDIIWLDDNGRVVGLERDVSPQTFPRIFYPESDAKYVLELKAGSAAEFGIEIGKESIVIPKL